MLLIQTTLQQSAVHGLGVFAAEPIAKGQKLWEPAPAIDGHVPANAVDSLPLTAQTFVYHYGYRMHANPDVYVLEFDHGRFMNHSPTPNTDFTNPAFGLATRDIAAGEEITCDYRQFCIPEDLLFLQEAS